MRFAKSGQPPTHLRLRSSPTLSMRGLGLLLLACAIVTCDGSPRNRGRVPPGLRPGNWEVIDIRSNRPARVAVHLIEGEYAQADPYLVDQSPILFAAWEDGRVVWSASFPQLSPILFEAHVDPARVEELAAEVSARGATLRVLYQWNQHAATLGLICRSPAGTEFRSRTDRALTDSMHVLEFGPSGVRDAGEEVPIPDWVTHNPEQPGVRELRITWGRFLALLREFTKLEGKPVDSDEFTVDWREN